MLQPKSSNFALGMRSNRGAAEKELHNGEYLLCAKHTDRTQLQQCFLNEWERLRITSFPTHSVRLSAPRACFIQAPYPLRPLPEKQELLSSGAHSYLPYLPASLELSLGSFHFQDRAVRGHCCKPPFNLIVLLFHPKHPAARSVSRLEGGRRYFWYGRDLAHLGSVPVALHSHFLGTLDANLKEDQERGELAHILPSWYIIPTSTMSPCHSCPQLWHFNRKKCLV